MFTKIQKSFVFLLFILFINNAAASVFTYENFEVEEALGNEWIKFELANSNYLDSCINCEPYQYYYIGFDESFYRFNISSTDGYQGLVDVGFYFYTILDTSPVNDLMGSYTIETSLDSAWSFSDSTTGSNSYFVIAPGLELETDYRLSTYITAWVNNDGIYDETYMEFDFSVPMVYTVTKSVPEPVSFVILLIGLMGFFGYRRRI